jgi:acetoin utilization deacetylase AcuC-like enzyme
MTHEQWEKEVAEIYARKVMSQGTGYTHEEALSFGMVAVLIGARGRSHKKTTPQVMADILWKKAGGK